MEYLNLPQWAEYLFRGLQAFVTIAASAVILSRVKRSPYFALLMAPIPYVPIIAVWALVLSMGRGGKNGAGEGI